MAGSYAAEFRAVPVSDSHARMATKSNMLVAPTLQGGEGLERTRWFRGTATKNGTQLQFLKSHMVSRKYNMSEMF